MKREFPFEMALKALEVTWSSLPPATADTNLQLWETRFSPKMSPSTSGIKSKNNDGSFSKKNGYYLILIFLSLVNFFNGWIHKKEFL